MSLGVKTANRRLVDDASGERIWVTLGSSDAASSSYGVVEARA